MRLTLFAAAVVLVAVPFSTLLLQVLAKGPLTRVDGSVADWLNDAVHGSALLVDLIQVVTFFGTTLWLTVAVIAAVVILGRPAWPERNGRPAWPERSGRPAWPERSGRPRRWRLAVFLVVTSLGGGLLNATVKAAVDRPRPVVDHPVATASGKSFPSGHAMSSTVVYGALLLVFLPVVPQRRQAVAMTVTAVVVLTIGSSRLLLGVHFLTDVVGGYMLGMAWLALATAAFQIWRIERGESGTGHEKGAIRPSSVTGSEGVRRRGWCRRAGPGRGARWR